MEFDYDKLEEGFSNLEKHGKTGKRAENESFQKIGEEKISALREIITEIERLIKERVALSRIICGEVEKIKLEIDNFLLGTIAQDSEDFKERSGLRQKKVEVAELELNEKINCWRDVALLKKELRERQRELNEKEDRRAMLEQILD